MLFKDRQWGQDHKDQFFPSQIRLRNTGTESSVLKVTETQENSNLDPTLLR